MLKNEQLLPFLGRMGGAKLWLLRQWVITQQAVNTYDKPHAIGTWSVDDFADDSIQYVESGFDRNNLLVKLTAEQWFFCPIMTGKGGDPIKSKNHVYEINEVEALRRYDIPDTDPQVFIAKGFVGFKAYAK